jgi:epoxyqueuosine reductase
MEPAGVRERLEHVAAANGFDAVGFTRLVPTEREAEYRAWLDRGDHAGMEWLGRNLERRFDPRRQFEGARSAMVVAVRYHPLADQDGVGGDLWPKVAKYARGRDYHRVIERGLGRCAEALLEEVPGAMARWYVDHGPVLERELAARAGLGWVGKHTLLLSRELGSWFLLGELFTDVDLGESEQATDLCGRCTRCLDACPTGALPEPYRVDARRCISYWTIEHRGAIPAELRDRFEGWVFGCDICQDACPWNARRREPADHPELGLPDRRRELDLVSLVALDQQGFEQRFAGSAMMRPKRVGMQRNAVLAMAHHGERYREPLRRVVLEHPEPLVRQHAVWALGQLGDDGPDAVLVRALEQEPEAEVRAEIQAVLARARSSP